MAFFVDKDDSPEYTSDFEICQALSFASEEPGSEGDSGPCPNQSDGVPQGRGGESLRSRNQRQVSRIFQELVRKHGPDLSHLSLEEINETAAELIWKKSDRLPGSKGGRK